MLSSFLDELGPYLEHSHRVGEAPGLFFIAREKPFFFSHRALERAVKVIFLFRDKVVQVSIGVLDHVSFINVVLVKEKQR